MGSSEDHDHERSTSSARSSIGDEETLPLYSEAHVVSADTDLTPPAPRVTPDEVRDFLVQLLINTRGLHVDQARRIASRWKNGTGRELKSYPPLMYSDIFGLEDGWIVYKEAKLCILKFDHEKSFYNHGGKYIAPALFLIFEVAVAITIASSLEFGYKFFAGIFGGIVCFVFLIYLLAVFCELSPEDKIEAQLRNGLTESKRT